MRSRNAPARTTGRPLEALAGWLTVLALSGVTACSAGSPASSTSSSGEIPPSNDASAPEDASQTDPDGGTSLDAASFHGIELVVDGTPVTLDPSSFTAGTISDFNGTVWVTTIAARIVNGESFSWNTEKLPLQVEFYDEASRKSPLPLGAFSCGRGSFGEPSYGLSKVTVHTVASDGLRDLAHTQSDDASCKTQFEQWANGYRGSVTGDLKPIKANAKTLPFSMRWNVPKGGK